MTTQSSLWEAVARGETFDLARDGARIRNALQRIYHHLRDGHICTLSEMAQAGGCSPAAASARWRELRDPQKCNLAGRKWYAGNGRWLYQLASQGADQ